MKREQLDSLVWRDLEHIARGEKGSLQSALRMVYNAHRHGDLTHDPASLASDTLERSIASVHRFSNAFHASYDRAYFGELPLTRIRPTPVTMSLSGAPRATYGGLQHRGEDLRDADGAAPAGPVVLGGPDRR